MLFFFAYKANILSRIKRAILFDKSKIALKTAADVNMSGHFLILDLKMNSIASQNLRCVFEIIE